MLHFRNRTQAGDFLANELVPYLRFPDTIVYAIPRGGVIVGFEVAKKLELPLDIVIARRISYPGYPEYAIGSLTERGGVLNENELVDESWVRSFISTREEIQRYKRTYLFGRDSLPAAGKTAIVIDDGIATGLTMRAALAYLRVQKPKKLIVAVPVAPREVVKNLREEVHKVIVLEDTDPFLGSVGAYYEEFFEVADQEVVSRLEMSREQILEIH